MRTSFQYNDFGELANAINEMPDRNPRTIAELMPVGMYEVIQDAADEDIEYIDALEVHAIRAHPGGLMGIEYSYDLTAHWGE